MSKWKQTSLPCPCGKSSDAYALDKEGDGYCFSCNKLFNKETVLEGEERWDYYPNRGVNRNTLEFYKTSTKFIGDTPVETGFKYPNGHYKIRNLLSKTKKERFKSTNGFPSDVLYGADLFDPASKESITISEGEMDAHSIYQITGGTTASTSVTSAIAARSICTKYRDYINSFKKIIFNFDNDDPGKAALKSVQGLFDFNKVYVTSPTKYKDATEYLENNEGQALYSLWRNASRYTPESLISSYSQIEKALEEGDSDILVDFPFKEMNEKIWGLFPKDFMIIKGLEGIGKSEILRYITYHILQTTEVNIGLIHIEEDNSVTIKSLASYHAGIALNNPETGYSKNQIMEIYKDMTKGNDARIYIHSSSSVDNENDNALLDDIRFMATVGGVKVAIVDHISWFATGLTENNDDERRKLDRLSQGLKKLAKELDIAIIAVSHVNDAGQTRGSRNITKVADIVLHLDRNPSHIDPIERSKTYMTIEKARQIC